MRLTTKAIENFKDKTRLKTRIALEMGKSVYSVDRWIDVNESNGPLTTARVLQLIQEETELLEAEILEDESVEQNTN